MALKGSCHLVDHFSRFCRSFCNLFSPSDRTVPYNLQSSANSLQMFICTSLGISLMKIINNMGPITEPCGTPLKTSFHCESFPATFTHCVLFFKKDFIHSSISPVNPRLSILTINLSWATQKPLRNLCISHRTILPPQSYLSSLQGIIAAGLCSSLQARIRAARLPTNCFSACAPR